jgi:fatty acid desaturase
MITSPERPFDIPAPQRAIVRKRYKKEIPENLRVQLLALERKDNWHNLFYIGSDWLVIVAAIALTLTLGMNPLIYILAVIVIGSRQRGLMNLLHEASHGKMFRNRTMNDWGGRFFTTYPMGASLSAYRVAHFIHHGWLWDEEKDPKTIRYQELGLVVPPSDRLTFFKRHILRPLLLAHVAHNIAAALSLKGERRSETIVRFGFLALVFAGVIIAHALPGFLLFWVVPFCTSFQIIRYWNEMAEHAGLPDYNAWMATRNWRSNLVMEWLLAPHSDDLYHLAHHLFPLIPHYRLAAAHRLLMQLPQYAGAHHCDGFFFPRRADAPSVLQDIRRPQDIYKYHSFRAIGTPQQASEASMQED